MNYYNVLLLGIFLTVFILSYFIYFTVDLKSSDKLSEYAAFIYSVVMMVLSAIGFVLTGISIFLGLFVR